MKYALITAALCVALVWLGDRRYHETHIIVRTNHITEEEFEALRQWLEHDPKLELESTAWVGGTWAEGTEYHPNTGENHQPLTGIMSSEYTRQPNPTGFLPSLYSIAHQLAFVSH